MKFIVFTILIAGHALACDAMLSDDTPKIPLNETSCFIDRSFIDDVSGWEFVERGDSYMLFQAGDQTVIAGDYQRFTDYGIEDHPMHNIQPHFAATAAAIGIGIARCAGHAACRKIVSEGLKWSFSAYAGNRFTQWLDNL